MSSEVIIRELRPDEASARIADLVDVIRDAVDGGSSVNFLADVTDGELREFWIASIGEQQLGRRTLLVAEHEGRVVATTLLMFAPQPNQSHRAEIAKMIVHSSHRRRGLARRLLAAAESVAWDRGRTLLMLDTEKNSDGERLYAATGWTRYGEVPGHALKPDGTPWPTSFFYKVLPA